MVLSSTSQCMCLNYVATSVCMCVCVCVCVCVVCVVCCVCCVLCVCGSVHTYIPCFVAKTDEGQHFLHTSDVSLC